MSFPPDMNLRYSQLYCNTVVNNICMSFAQVKVWLCDRFPKVELVSQRICGVIILLMFE